MPARGRVLPAEAIVQRPRVGIRSREPRLAYSAVGFEILGEVRSVEVIAVGAAIREVARLRRVYGLRRWRKLKGVVIVRLDEGTIGNGEVHWYEAHGVGRKELKIKRFLGD